LTRVAIGSLMAVIGYLVMYAGIADKGKYCLRPWAALAA